jgi:hypothetical protein
MPIRQENPTLRLGQTPWWDARATAETARLIFEGGKAQGEAWQRGLLYAGEAIGKGLHLIGQRKQEDKTRATAFQREKELMRMRHGFNLKEEEERQKGMVARIKAELEARGKHHAQERTAEASQQASMAAENLVPVMEALAQADAAEQLRAQAAQERARAERLYVPPMAGIGVPDLSKADDAPGTYGPGDVGDILHAGYDAAIRKALGDEKALLDGAEGLLAEALKRKGKIDDPETRKKMNRAVMRLTRARTKNAMALQEYADIKGNRQRLEEAERNRRERLATRAADYEQTRAWQRTADAEELGRRRETALTLYRNSTLIAKTPERKAALETSPDPFMLYEQFMQEDALKLKRAEAEGKAEEKKAKDARAEEDRLRKREETLTEEHETARGEVGDLFKRIGDGDGLSDIYDERAWGERGDVTNWLKDLTKRDVERILQFPDEIPNDAAGKRLSEALDDLAKNKFRMTKGVARRMSPREHYDALVAEFEKDLKRKATAEEKQRLRALVLR